MKVQAYNIFYIYDENHMNIYYYFPFTKQGMLFGLLGDHLLILQGLASLSKRFL